MRKLNRRLIVVLIEFVLILGILATSMSQAATDVEFEVKSASGENNSEVTVSVDMKNSSDFAAANFILEYDTTKLEYVSSEKGTVLNTGMIALINNDSVTGKVSIAYTADPSATNHTKEAGNLLQVTFKIKANATGTANLNLTCTTLKTKSGTDITNLITQGNVKIIKKLSSISLNKSTLELTKGNNETLTVTYNPADTTADKTVTWVSSNEKVATVDSTGKVTAVGGGQAVIKARVETKIASCNVNVLAPLVSISLNKTTTNLVKGQIEKIKVIYNPEDTTDNKTVNWTSSDETVAKIANDGTITAIKEGTATIEANVNGKTASIDVTVKEIPLNSIEIDKKDISLLKGKTEKLSVLYNPEDTTDDKTVIWKSSDETIAKVDDNGTVTAIKEGKVTITADVNGKTATVQVEVTEKHIDSISIENNITTVEKDKNVKLNLAINPEDTTDEKNIVWESSDETIAKVDDNGIVTAIKEGKVAIKAIVNGKYEDEINIEVIVKEETLENEYNTEKESNVGEENKENTVATNIPQTGDTGIMLYIVLALVSIIGITVIAIKKRK